MRISLTLLSVAATALAASSASAVNLVVNGGFESDPAPVNAYQQYFGGQSFTGWTVGGNDILIIDSGYTEAAGAVGFVANSGKNSLDITGAGNTGSTDSITQTIATTAGLSYTLTFSVGRTDGDSNYTTQSSIGLSIDGGVIQTFTNSGLTPGNVNWKQFSTTFIAAGPTVLKFSNTTPDNSYAGLDDVTVNAVPEPASMAALGLGAVALLRRRKRA